MLYYLYDIDCDKYMYILFSWLDYKDLLISFGLNEVKINCVDSKIFEVDLCILSLLKNIVVVDNLFICVLYDLLLYKE